MRSMSSSTPIVPAPGNPSTGGTTLGIGAAENDTAQTGQHDRSRAHRARFFRHVEIAIVEPPIADRRLGLRDGQHLGMGRGVPQHLHLVPRATDHLTITHNDGTHRHLIRRRGLVRAAQGALHVKNVRLPVEALDFIGAHRNLPS